MNEAGVKNHGDRPSTNSYRPGNFTNNSYDSEKNADEPQAEGDSGRQIGQNLGSDLRNGGPQGSKGDLRKSGPEGRKSGNARERKSEGVKWEDEGDTKAEQDVTEKTEQEKEVDSRKDKERASGQTLEQDEEEKSEEAKNSYM